MRPAAGGGGRAGGTRGGTPAPGARRGPARSISARTLAAATAVAAALAVGLAPPAAATPVCKAPSLLLRWPEERPVWEMCWTRPRDSKAGLELTDVRYRGLPALERASVGAAWAVPAAEGDAECAGRCVRADLSAESRFAAGAEVIPGYHEPDPATPGATPLWPWVTVCDRPAGAAPGDCPWGEPLACAPGVAVERGAERLTLTTQLATAHLRPVMSWTFHLDGTIEPRFGFGRGGGACAGTPAREHVTWRLDFDLGIGDRLLPDPDGPGWRVVHAAGGRGFRVVPGAGDLDPAVHAGADDPGPPPAPAGACAFDPAELRPFDPEGDWRARDLVLWYHAAAPGDGTGCRRIGPTLVPFGTWPRLEEVVFEDGFESGDLGAWTAHRP